MVRIVTYVVIVVGHGEEGCVWLMFHYLIIYLALLNLSCDWRGYLSCNLFVLILAGFGRIDCLK